MVGVGNKPRQPAQDERNAADVARCIRWVILNVRNRFPVIPLVRDKRIWELTVCPPTIAALENTKLVLYLASRRINGLPAASPSDKQIPLTTRAEKNLLRDNYNEIALVLFPKS
jgi:hypothetical protein